MHPLLCLRKACPCLSDPGFIDQTTKWAAVKDRNRSADMMAITNFITGDIRACFLATWFSLVNEARSQ